MDKKRGEHIEQEIMQLREQHDSHVEEIEKNRETISKLLYEKDDFRDDLKLSNDMN